MPLKQHVVICNLNPKVPGIIDQLLAARPPVEQLALLVQDKELWDEHPSWHPHLDPADSRLKVVFGCPSDLAALEEVAVANARAVVIVADPRFAEHADARSALVGIAIERTNPQVHTVMELVSSLSRLHVRATEINEVICIGEISEKLIAQSCITPGIQHVLEHLLDSASTTAQLQLVPLAEEAYGMSYRELCREAIVSGAPFTICGFVTDGEPTTYVLNPLPGCQPGRDSSLGPDNRIIAIAHGPVSPIRRARRPA